ncbi:hypothetical protein BLOT_010823, partial [Blomia tropicalis]
ILVNIMKLPIGATKHLKTNLSKMRNHLFEKQLSIMFRTVGLILMYYFFSIGITFYQKWFIKRFHYPLIVVVCHMFFKYFIAVLIRAIYRQYTGLSRISLSWRENVSKIAQPGVASALDIGFSNWSFEFITISLYTMTKSTCIIFILLFAIYFELEKPHWSLLTIVGFISIGLFMFTYKSTQFQLNGFLLVLSASMLSGLRWTLSQKLMQRKESSLSNPIDMMYHVQPWMIAVLLPLAFYFELMPSMKSYFFSSTSNQTLTAATAADSSLLPDLHLADSHLHLHRNVNAKCEGIESKRLLDNNDDLIHFDRTSLTNTPTDTSMSSSSINSHSLVINSHSAL